MHEHMRKIKNNVIEKQTIRSRETFKTIQNLQLLYCKFCIHTHPVNLKFSIWHLHEMPPFLSLLSLTFFLRDSVFLFTLSSWLLHTFIRMVSERFTGLRLFLCRSCGAPPSEWWDTLPGVRTFRGVWWFLRITTAGVMGPSFHTSQLEEEIVGPCILRRLSWPRGDEALRLTIVCFM